MKRFTIFILILACLPAFATDKWYKAGANTNVNTLGNWWLNSSWTIPAVELPRTSDSVFFISGAGSCVINAAFSCYSANFTGWNGALTGASAWTCSGQLTLGSAGTYTGCTSPLTFNSTTTGWKIYHAGRNLGMPYYFNGAGGGWKLMDSYNNPQNYNFWVLQGTFDMNGFDVYTSYFYSTGTLTRTLMIGTGTITVYSSNAGTQNFDCAEGTGLTVAAHTGKIKLTGSQGFGGGGKTWNRLEISNPTRIQTHVGISGANTFGDLIITTNATNMMEFGDNQTVIDTLKIQGYSRGARCLIMGYKSTGRIILTAGTHVYNYVDFFNIETDHAVDLSMKDAGNMGDNANITFPTPVKRFAKIGASASYSWSSTTMWCTASGGTTGASVPIPGDTAVFDAATLSADAKTISVDQLGLVKNIDFTNIDQTVTITFSGYPVLNEKLILGTRAIMGTGYYIFQLYGNTSRNYTLECNGTRSLFQSFSYNGLATLSKFNSTGGQCTIYNSGNYQFVGDNSISSLSVSGINASNGPYVNLGSGTMTITNPSAQNFRADSYSYIDGSSAHLLFNIAATGSMSTSLGKSGSTYNKISLTPPTVPVGTTQFGFSGGSNGNLYVDSLIITNGNKITINSGNFYINYLVSGGNPIDKVTLKGSTSFYHSNIILTNRACLDYMNIDYLYASGPGFFAGANSVNGGHNSGVSFTPCISGDVLWYGTGF